MNKSQDNSRIKCVAVVYADSNPQKEKCRPFLSLADLPVSFIFLKEVKLAKAILEKVLKRHKGKRKPSAQVLNAASLPNMVLTVTVRLLPPS